MNSSTTTMRSHVAQREENSSFSAWRRPTSPPGRPAPGVAGAGARGAGGGGAAGRAGGGGGDPAAAAVEVDDDVAGAGTGFDLGHHEVHRRRRREAVERGQARPPVRPYERREQVSHRASV